jgi:hypothetical protein
MPEDRGHLGQLRERSQNWSRASSHGSRPHSPEAEALPVGNLAPPNWAKLRPPLIRAVPGDKVRDFAELVVVAIYALAAFAEIAMLLIPAA